MQGTINMATIAISALPSATAAATTDVLPIVQGGTTKQVTNALLFTNSTLVTPVLGTPTSGTLTNCTGLPVATGISGLASGIATFLATPSSANLRTALTDETGTGSAVFANTPTLVTPEIGVATGTSLTLSGFNATNAAAPTIASASTIAPTKQITFISGTASVATITAPSPISAGGGVIRLIPTGLFTWTTGGNIAVAGAAVLYRMITMVYDSGTSKWYPSYV